MLALNAKPEEMHARAAKEAEAMLMRGFTAVRDVGGPVFDLKKSIDRKFVLTTFGAKLKSTKAKVFVLLFTGPLSAS